MAGSLEFIKSASGTSVSSLSVTDCFSADYDVYFISTSKIDTSSAGYVRPRFINSSGITTGSNYDQASIQLRSWTTFGEYPLVNYNSFLYTIYQTADSYAGTGLSMYVYNPYDSSSYTFMNSQSSSQNPNGHNGYKSIGVYKVAEQITGFALTDITFDNVTVNVYGVK